MARACDRCSRLKTQCNGDRPCNRCQRLALDCTQTRPVLAKGRPKRDTVEPRKRRTTHTSQQTPSQSTSPQAYNVDVLSYPPASETSLSLVHNLHELPLPEPIAAYLLDLVFPPISEIGLLEVFSLQDSCISDHPSPVSLSAKRTKLSPLPPTSSKALLYALLVFGASLCTSHHSTINLSDLEQCVINSIPALYGGCRDLSMEDALSLCYLSHVNCLNLTSAKVAARWAVLATTIAHEVQEAEDGQNQIAFHRRSLWAIHINDRIFSLLHYRPPAEKNLKIPKPYQRLRNSSRELDGFDKMSIVGVLESPSINPQHHMATDYFALYLPLLSSLDMALEEPQTDSPKWSQAITELNQYYSDFPQTLKTYNDIKIMYQVEVIIWYHGIFLLLYGRRDLYDCLNDISWSTSPSFLSCIEHSQLIGETIPTIARLMRTSNELSPATIYFILLSTVIHGVALRKCMETYSTTPQTHASGWAKLVDSTHLHLFLLRKIRETSTACTIELLHDVERVIQPIYMAATTSSDAGPFGFDISPLRFYRWISEGRGIIKLSQRSADALSTVPLSSSRSNGNSPVERSEVVRDSILGIFDVHTRTMGPGQFCQSVAGKM